MIDILLYSHHLPAYYCIDIVRRNSVLVTCGSERVKLLASPPLPQTMLYCNSINFKLYRGNIERGRGGLVNDLECGRNRSVIQHIN